MKKILAIITIALLSASCESDNSMSEDLNTDTTMSDTLSTDEFDETMNYEPLVDQRGMEYKLGPQSDIALVDKYGDDSIYTDSDGIQYFVYPARDTIWLTSE